MPLEPVEALLITAWLLTALATTGFAAAYLYRLGPGPPNDDGPFPSILVLLPIRAGSAADLPAIAATLAAVEAQDYPGPWRAVLALESANDPAFALASAADPGRFTVVLAGPAQQRGQKVQNLLAALATRRTDDALVVTLDVDALPPPFWLKALTRPIRLGRAEIATGYRWLVPDAGLASVLVALADHGVATGPRLGRVGLVWGGSTALSSQALKRLDLPSLWDRALSDDLTLARAAAAAGMPAFVALHVLLPSPLRLGWRGVLAFGRRQYLLLRLHAPHFAALAGVTLILPLLGVAAAFSAALGGSKAAVGALIIGAVLQQARVDIRRRIGIRVLAGDSATALRREGLRAHLLQPAAHLLNVGLFLSSFAGRDVVWAGRRYRLRREDSQVVSVQRRV